jgi:creatinine amidohydrolase
MQWEHLTADDFAQAVRDTGVCVLSMGVLERHSAHLPLGTDYLNAHRIACLAAEREPAVVFPPFYFGQIYEARCFPGTVTLPPAVLMQVLEGVMQEIARNGFAKIVLYSGHGGNKQLVDVLAQFTLAERKPYTLYVYKRHQPDAIEATWQAVCETRHHGHACECETSISLANYPDLVRMERVPQVPALPLRRLDHLQGSFSGISWYADYPEHYAGDARSASAQKGMALREAVVADLAAFIAAVRADPHTPALEDEFHNRTSQPL